MTSDSGNRPARREHPLFRRALRAAGLPVGPGAVLDALEAVKAAGIGTREDFYWTLHAVFVKRHEHSMLFDQAFRLFFRKRAYLERLMSMMMPQVQPAPHDEKQKPATQRIQDALFSGLDKKDEREQREVELDARLTVSDRELLQRKDFAQMTAAEIAAAKDAIRKLVLPLNEVQTRRLTPHRHGHVIDMRRTLRASLKAGGALHRSEVSRPEDEGAADRRAARYFRLDEPVHRGCSCISSMR